ncbi:MAG: FUSC family protein [Acidobacteria bacterium]|nr:FUSC family protein [Acidobacteriota bacterium]
MLATTDPDWSRLRLASTTIATLIVVAGVLFVGATATGQAVTTVIPGVILAMIASMAVREVKPRPRALTILLLVPASLAAISLAAVLAQWPLVVDAVFVAVAVGAVFLRALGPRGTALGMLAFMSYFLAVFVRITPRDLLVVAAAQLVAAGVTILIRLLLASRRGDHDLRRMIAALGYRARRVVDALVDGVEAGGFDERLRRTARSRLAASSATASSVEDVLESAETPVLDGIGNDELGVRVLDFQLTMERLVEAVQVMLDGDVSTAAEREDLTSALGRFARAVDGPIRLQRSAPDGAAGASSPTPARTSARLDRIDRILSFGTASWRGVAWRGRDVSAAPDDDASATETAMADVAEHVNAAEDDADGAAGIAQRLRGMSRQAVQVGLAAALAIAAGTAISSTRWFWAVIAAFVVYVGTSSRGEILTKGWLRVVGTLAGVVVGVVVAALVGGNTLLAVILIVVCLFAGVYLVSVSSAFMIFFITTMLALLYGLLGEFSIGLLLTRLTETAAGAMIGVGVAYVVLPTSTRDVARERMRDYLEALAEAVTHAVDRLTLESADAGGMPGADEARAVRTAFEALRTAATPITKGLAGLADRSGSRRTMQILGVCEYHCRALLRLADGAPGIAATPALRASFREAATGVRADIHLLATAAGGQTESEGHDSAAQLLDALEAHADMSSSPDRTRLAAAAADLRAIDRAARDRAEEVGVTSVVKTAGPLQATA